MLTASYTACYNTNTMNNEDMFFKMTWQKIDQEYSQRDNKTDEDIKKDVALKLDLYIKKHRLTHEEVAKKIGVTRMQVFRWLQMKSKPSNAVMKLMKQEGIL